ncbi:hypothetical protein MKX03_013999 [Papaver bracteatum]|nr:hypothetical protein MKX03_013999 [Papaver bracteatum]
MDQELLKTACTGNLDRFKRLALKHVEAQGIEVGKLVDKDGDGCLHFAADGGSLNICKYLLETLKFDVDSKDGKGYTPLFHAMSKGHLDTVRYLLEKGANVDASDGTNETPLQYAAREGDTKLMAFLLSKGAHVDVATRLGTALQMDAAFGHQDVVKMLLNHGANPNVGSHENVLKPLYLAIYTKAWESVELLLKKRQVPYVKPCVSGSFGFSYRHPLNVVN